jgi:cation transport ATPase
MQAKEHAIASAIIDAATAWRYAREITHPTQRLPGHWVEWAVDESRKTKRYALEWQNEWGAL